MKRYTNVKTNKTTPKYDSSNQSVIKYDTTIYDDVPALNSDIYVITQHGDRLDNLANQFYGDPSLWWFIARANNLVTMNVDVGKNLRIPATTSKAKAKRR